MALTDYNVDPSAILKDVYLGPIREHLNNKRVLMKRLQRNTTDFQGNQAVCSIHTGRNPGVGARAIGARLPRKGTQSHTKTYIDTKYNYGRFYVDGVNMRKTRGSKGAFARLVDTEINGMTRDLEQEIQRQLFSDGSGILAVNGAGTSTTGTTGNAIFPYLWSPAGKYLKGRTNLELQTLDISDMTTHDPVTADGDTTGLRVASTTTNTKLYWGTGTWATPAANDVIGTYRGLQDAGVRYEMMGLSGIVTDSNLFGDSTWDYPGEYTAGSNGGDSTGVFIGPEGQAGVYAVTGIENELQSIDADANAFWRSYVDGNNGVPRALSLNMMDDAFGEMVTNVGADISLMVTTWQVRNKYVDLLRADRRYVNTMKLDGGFDAVEYNGIPFVVDKDCPRGTIFLLDESVLELFVLNDFDWISDNGGQVLHWIADYHAFEASLWYGAELATKDRNKCGKIIDINEV